MPFTPLHLGPGLIIKAVAPSHFSLTAYTLANVAVDLEPLYHILRGDYPLHGPMHTLPLATLTGLLVGAGVSLLPKAFRDGPAAEKLPDALRAEFRLPECIVAGVLGGMSHSLINSIIYTDFHPLAPFSVQNPLHGLITPNALFYSLFLTGVIGLVLLAIRALLVWRAGR